MKIKYLGIALFLFCISISATAQTADDLQSRHGKTLDAFYVRSDILMTLEYSGDGQLRKAIIEARHFPKTDGKASVKVEETGMLPEIVTEILEEIMPTDRRGSRINAITFNASCTTLESEIFEKVEIYKTYTCSKKEKKIISSAQIRWRND